MPAITTTPRRQQRRILTAGNYFRRENRALLQASRNWSTSLSRIRRDAGASLVQWEQNRTRTGHVRHTCMCVYVCAHDDGCASMRQRRALLKLHYDGRSHSPAAPFLYSTHSARGEEMRLSVALAIELISRSLIDGRHRCGGSSVSFFPSRARIENTTQDVVHTVGTSRAVFRESRNTGRSPLRESRD